MTDDERFMDAALLEAARAAEAGEVPIGAVVVVDGALLAKGFNQPIASHDPTAHAEIVALRAATRALGNYRLPGASLYVTVEPCLMCVGAALHARVARIIFGAVEPKFGALVSLLDANRLGTNHRFEIVAGVGEAAAREQMRSFFAARRPQGG